VCRVPVAQGRPRRAPDWAFIVDVLVLIDTLDDLGHNAQAVLWGAKTLFTPRQIRDLQAGR